MYYQQADRKERKGSVAEIDAGDLSNKELNFKLEDVIKEGAKRIIIKNVNGHRYIAAGFDYDVEIIIEGVAGDDLGAFMNGPRITVYGNAQDAPGNTMNAGEITIHGDARDIVGHSMRGGRIFVKGDVGYRVGIHMKEYKGQKPVIIAGGSAGDFLGEYLAGGVIIILGIDKKSDEVAGDFIAGGIHGGRIFVRGDVKEHHLAFGAKIDKISDDDKKILEENLKLFAAKFNYDEKEILSFIPELTKIAPKSHRPFGDLYTHEKKK